MRHGDLDGQSPPHPEIEVVQRSGSDADPNFTGSRLRHRQVRETQDLGTAMLRENRRFHGRNLNRGRAPGKPLRYFPCVSDAPSPADSAAAPDATLRGYVETHNRPPAFEGPDGSPFTVSVEVEKTGDLRAPYAGYLVFPRWADTGVGIVGHVESPVLIRGRDRADVEERLGDLPLTRVREELDRALHASSADSGQQP